MVEPTIDLAFIGLILSVLMFFLGVIFERKKTKKENRRELILEYYPPLAENIRYSLSDISKRYIQRFQEHDHYFEFLVEMANKSTLKIIEGLDKKLYDDLNRILDHFFPAEAEIERKKDESWEEVRRKWQKWIEDNFYDIPKCRLTPETLANEYNDSLRWPLWRKDELLLIQNFDSNFDRNFVKEGDEEKYSKSKKWIFEEIVRIAEEELNPIKDEYEKLHQDLNDLVQGLILPKMDKMLKSLGD